MTARMVAVAVALGGLLLWPAVGEAQDDPVALFNRASELAEQGNLSDAISLWLIIADEIPEKYRPVVRSNLGLAYKSLGKLQQAWFHFERYLELDATPDPEVVAWHKEVETKLLANHRKVKINCLPAGARLYLLEGGDDRGFACPVVWWFPLGGEGQVMVKKEGLKSRTHSFPVAMSMTQEEVTVDLGGESDMGELLVEGDGRAVQVFIDGKLEGKVPFRRKMAPGSYELMVGKPGQLPWKKSITIVAGKTVTEAPEVARKSPDEPPAGGIVGGGGPVTVTAAPSPSSSGPGWWVWTAMGVGVACIAGGGAMHYLAATRDAELLDTYPDGSAGKPTPGIYADRYSDGYDEEVRPKAMAAYALYGVGGAALATGATLLIIHASGRGKKEPAPVTLAPSLDGFGFAMQLGW